MTRRVWVAVVVAAAMLAALVPAAAATTPPLPGSIAAVGDSITQAASTGGGLGTDYPANSWSTGTNSTVNSHYLRLLALNSGISGQSFNRSVSGAKMADLDGQMATAAALHPDYLTVLIGGNDLCTDTAGQMTSVIDFGTQFETALRTLAATSPNTNVYLSSVPNVYHLWELFKGSWWARLIWSAGNICQSLLASPTSTNQTDVARRASVAQRNVDYNTALADVCAQYARCLWDENAAYDTVFAKSDVSGDYFHPSIAGQAKLAAVSWGASYWAAGAPPPPPTNQPPTVNFTYSCTFLACSFNGSGSTDADGTIASYAWTFGDGGSGAGVAPGHTFSAAGTYSVKLEVTDNGGATGSTTQPIEVFAAPPPPSVGTVTIGALDPSSASRKGGWTATVTITVRDGSGTLVSGAAVTGTWSSGSSGSCTTTDGTCTVSQNMNKKTSSVIWTVTDVTLAGYNYVAGSLTSTTVSAP